MLKAVVRKIASVAFTNITSGTNISAAMIVGTGASLSATGSGTITATNTTNSAITNDTTTNATMYPIWVTANTGNLPLKVSDTKVTFNPSTGTLSSTILSGAVSATGNITMGNGIALRTDTTTAHTALVQAYDVNDATYRTFGTLTNGNTPSVAWSQPAGGALSWDGGAIGATTPAAGTFTNLELTGQAEIKKYYEANSGAAITIDFANGAAQAITITENTTITFPNPIATGKTQEIDLYLIQPGPTIYTIAINGGDIAYSGYVPSSTIESYAGTIHIKCINTPGAGVLLYPDAVMTGVFNATEAPSGYVGEFKIASVAAGAPISLTTNTVTEVTHIDLTQGDWEISGYVTFSGGAITGVKSQAFIGTASGSSTTGQDLALNTNTSPFTATAAADLTLTIPPFRVNTTNSVTYYIKALSTFTVGSATAYGHIQARRSSNLGANL